MYLENKKKIGICLPPNYMSDRMIKTLSKTCVLPNDVTFIGASLVLSYDALC